MPAVRRRLPMLPILATLSLPLAACGLLGTSTPPASETVASVCVKVVDCGDWGWLDQAECEEGFLDNPDYATECEDPDAYLQCMPDCMEMDCNAFDVCEGDCWAGACE